MGQGHGQPMGQSSGSSGQGSSPQNQAAQALSNLDNASSGLSQGAPARDVQEAGRRAEQALREAAREATRELGQTDQPKPSGQKNSGLTSNGRSNGAQGGGNGGAGDNDYNETSVMPSGASSPDWNKLPSQLKDDVLQSIKEKYPQEWEEHIRRYYKALSEQSEKKN
jgi:hypothetical protein